MMRAGELVAIDNEQCDNVATVVSYEDDQFLARLRAGEQAAYEELVSKYHGSVYSLALRLTNDREDAYDIAQETFLKVYNNIHRFRGDSELRTWIYRITVNQAANQQRWWRRRRRDRSVSIDAANDDEQPLSQSLACKDLTPEQRALAAEQRRMIMVALGQVKFDFRVAVILRDIEGLSYEEIADTLEVSVGTVKSRIARGREDLRQQLKGSF
ncbi:MAG: sigma-70 family RNA polymerase sigma factor [Acidobacteriota bacterium]